MERPLGSFMFLKAASQARASGVEQATLGTEGTLRAALSHEKCSSKNRTVIIFFLVLRCVDRETVGSMGSFLRR